MLMIANLLALALVVADEPTAPKTPIGSKDVVAVTPTGSFFMGAQEISLEGFEPVAPKPALPKVARPSLGGHNPEAVEAWPLPLPEAIRIGLRNSEIIRIGSEGGDPKDNRAGVVIYRVVAETSPWAFKAAVMAHVRSIEQQYWALAQQRVALWSRETAVKLGEEILRREKDELKAGRSNPAKIAEAEQQLENFQLYLVTATSDLITTERQLRNILGLPAADSRRIVPETPPTEAKLEPEWEATLATMLASQPEIALQRQLVGMAEFKAVLEGENPTLPADRRESSKSLLEKQQAFLQQVIHQATHSLARFFLEIDANHKQFQTAQRLRKAAQDRLEAQRAFYDEGRVALDRLLDAVGQYANAVAQEAQYKFSYNASIAALEEAKGTLLAHDGITVTDQAPPKKAPLQPKDDRVAPAFFQSPEPVAAPAPAPAPAQPASTTYKLRAKLGGIKMWEIELEINQTPAAPAR
jgi:Outer membrane efflux protein